MKLKILPIIVLFLIIILAATGLVLRLLRTSKSVSNTQETVLEKAETNQAQLAQLNITANTPQVGEDIIFNLAFDEIGTKISAISINFNLPYQTTSPFKLKEAPFSLNQQLIDAGWQILINRVDDDVENKILKAQIAVGVINQGKQSTLPQPFAQLILPTKSETQSGQIVIDATSTKIVSVDNKTLPIQLVAKPYQVLPAQNLIEQNSKTQEVK